MDRKEIEDILKDYRWMINSIKVLRSSMKDAGERLVKQYGDDSDMPKPKGGTSDPIFQEIVRREKRWKVIAKYESKVQAIQRRVDVIKDNREAEILHWMLEGKSLRWIGLHMGLSHSHVQRIKEDIVNQLVNVPNVTDDTKLQKQKSHV